MKSFKLSVAIFLALLLSLAQTSGIVLKNEEDGAILIDTEYEALEIANKSPVRILKLRNFRTEVHFAHTNDGYNIYVVRVINPKASSKLKRPVIFNHGLFESATIWLINSRGVKPLSATAQCNKLPTNIEDQDRTRYLNLALTLSNQGYDVWIMSMRGTDYSLHHDFLSPKNPEFWNYSLDDFGLVDVPSVIDYVRGVTGAPKVGYVGHSQATFSIFALLSSRPNYADVLEPVVAIAPVSYFDHITSYSRALFLGTLTTTDQDKHGPFPPNAKKVRRTLFRFCDTVSPNRRELICQLLDVLVSGEGKHWLKGYFSHLPFYTSLKVLRHFGQLVKSKRFSMYDYGSRENERLYGSHEAPSYPIGRIRSKSIVLVYTKSDALSHLKDVTRFKEQLNVPFKEIFIDKDFNHFDLITDEDAAELVNKPILEIMESYERKTGICSLLFAKQKSSFVGPSNKKFNASRLKGRGISNSSIVETNAV